jgi:hypothetical protein
VVDPACSGVGGEEGARCEGVREGGGDGVEIESESAFVEMEIEVEV